MAVFLCLGCHPPPPPLILHLGSVSSCLVQLHNMPPSGQATASPLWLHQCHSTGTAGILQQDCHRRPLRWHPCHSPNTTKEKLTTLPHCRFCSLGLFCAPSSFYFPSCLSLNLLLLSLLFSSQHLSLNSFPLPAAPQCSPSRLSVLGAEHICFGEAYARPSSMLMKQKKPAEETGS